MATSSRLNSGVALRERVAVALRGATRMDVAVAYAKRTGVRELERIGVPPGSRFVISTGFALTEPAAVERLAELGVEVRLVLDHAEEFHPKLYLVEGSRLTVLSTSANLTGGGLSTNVEQYEELRLSSGSPEAGAQRA